MQLTQKIADIITEAGKIMISAINIEENTTEKTGTANFVTAYDISVQNFLYDRLSSLLPEARFICEESSDNHTELLSDGLSFIIDPIDGTTNFIHGYRQAPFRSDSAVTAL
jgi:myo-inositol-1(or 4)-monophosphatase